VNVFFFKVIRSFVADALKAPQCPLAEKRQGLLTLTLSDPQLYSPSLARLVFRQRTSNCKHRASTFSEIADMHSEEIFLSDAHTPYF